MVKKEVPGGTITLSGTLRMKEFRQMVAVESSGDFEAMYPMLARLVTAWELDGMDGLEPSDPESYDELTLPQFQAITQAAADYLTASMTAKN